MIACANCGHENPDSARFCNGCGNALLPAGATREERKIISVVFADLVGSTAMAERSDPEDVRAMLAAHYARVRTELERFGGTVEKFIGDAVVAVFGAPAIHEDDPERAVRAALAVRDAASQAGVQLRVAVNTGEALVSVNARPADGQAMVAGDVINTAARIQTAAPVNGVLVGETTYHATAHVIEYRVAEPFQAKGKAEAVKVWEAIGPRARFGSDVELAPLAPLVGREGEMASLRAALARAREEREPQLVTVVGVPGIGKSRLVAELFSSVDADPDKIVWRQGRCLPYGEGVSYWALGEMVKAQAGLLESDSADDAAVKLVDSVANLISDPKEAAWVNDHLRPLVGLGSMLGAGGDSQGETFAAWRRYCEGMCEENPAVLVFEDLHWADDGLLDFIDYLVDRASGAPLMVLCSARPELLVRRPGWGGGKPNAVTLSLSPLSELDTASLIGGYLRDAVLPPELQETLLRHAEGNPLFAVEYVRMLRDRGRLRLDGGEWRVEPGEISLPETVQGIIAARLDALAPDEKDVLLTASVIGKIFWLGSIVAVAGATRGEIEEWLHVLERKELIRRDRRASVAGETEYAIRHVLVRDVAYSQIPRARRADLHIRAARWIESLAGDRAEDRSEMRAYHYQSALDLMRAAGSDTGMIEAEARQALLDAGRRAYGLGALEASSSYFRRALQLWPVDDPAYADALFELGNALFWANNEGRAELTEAGTRYAEAGNVERAAEAESRLGVMAWRVGERDTAKAHIERSLALIAQLPDSPATAAIRSDAWRVQLLQGERLSVEEGKRILAITQELGTAEQILNARITLATSHAVLEHDLRAAVRELEGVVADALAANSHLVVRAYNNLASHLLELGEMGRAAEVAREGRAAARRFSNAHLLRWLQAAVIGHDMYAGSWDQAAAGAAEFQTQPGAGAYVDHQVDLALATITAARHGPAAASDAMALAVARARKIGDRQAVEPALAQAARLALDRGDRAEAAELLDELMDLMDGSVYQPETVEAAIAAEALGMGRDFSDRIAVLGGDAPWPRAAAAIALGRFAEGADLLESVGDQAHAALVRLVEAERSGKRTPGLEKAQGFYEGVGAAAYLRRAAAIGPA